MSRFETMHAMKNIAGVGIAAFATILIFTVATSVHASVVLHDTTGDPFDSFWLVGLSSSASGNINQPADSFVISGGNFRLESLTLDLVSSEIQSGGTPDDYAIRIWDNNVDRPGNLLESFTVPNSDSLSGLTTVNSSATPLLSNGDTYWVSAALPDDLSNGLWTGVEGTSNGRAVAFSNAESASWIASSSTTPLSLKVTGTLVPEPSTWALAVLCLLGVGFGCRWRR